jgi:hypothetical protein
VVYSSPLKCMPGHHLEESAALSTSFFICQLASCIFSIFTSALTGSYVWIRNVIKYLFLLAFYFIVCGIRGQLFLHLKVTRNWDRSNVWRFPFLPLKKRLNVEVWQD